MGDWTTTFYNIVYTANTTGSVTINTDLAGSLGARPKDDTALAWLDRRVDEMRVKL